MVFNLFSQKLQKIIEERGFKQPTPVQEKGIPTIMQGKNALLIAPTGIGKTESALLPIFDKWLKEKPAPISILYITPMRSLNRDLMKRMFWWSQKLDIEVSVRHGDTTQYQRKMQSEMPPDMLVVTPETLQAILPGKLMREHLANVRFVVVDEIHEIGDSKRGSQLSVGLERLRLLSPDFQTIGLSATVGSPETIAMFLTAGRPCEIIKTITPKELKINIEFPEPVKSDMALAEKIFAGVPVASRLRRISELMAKNKSILTFTNTREFAEILSSRLRKFVDEKIETHHGSLSRDVRIEAENQFREQKVKSLVCTSSLELGIDIGSIDMVIQYMSPRQVSKLIQRVGRSGHTIESESHGTIITTSYDDIFESQAIKNLALQEKLEEIKIHNSPLDVLAHQIIGILLSEYGASPERIFEIIKKSYAFNELSFESFISVVKQLNRLGLLWHDIDENKIKRMKRSWPYYFENLSTIPSTRNYLIFDVISNKSVGTLDEEFIALNGEIGTTFICKGQPWKILDTEENKIIVEPSTDIEAAIPAWEGELIPVPYEVAQVVSDIRENILNALKLKGDATEKIKKDYDVDKDLANKMLQFIKTQSRFVVPTKKKIFVENYESFVIIHTCFGSLVNETIGRALSSLLTLKMGSVRLKTDPYRIILQLPTQGTGLVKKAFQELEPQFLEEILYANIASTQLFTWKFVHNAKRFGAIDKFAEISQLSLKRIIKTYENSPIYSETLREIFLEKLDIEASKKILKDIKDKKIEIIFSDAKKLSPLGNIALDRSFGEIIGPERPEQEILKAFKQRIFNTRIRLVCANCGEWTWLGKVRECPNEIKCQRCGAKLIAFLRRYQREEEKLLKKYVRGKKLKEDEEKTVERIMATANLVMLSGKQAAIVLAGIGVGYKTAIRILSKHQPTEKSLLNDILQAERLYFKTKKFWH